MLIQPVASELKSELNMTIATITEQSAQAFYSCMSVSIWNLCHLFPSLSCCGQNDWRPLCLWESMFVKYSSCRIISWIRNKYRNIWATVDKSVYCVILTFYLLITNAWLTKGTKMNSSSWTAFGRLSTSRAIVIKALQYKRKCCSKLNM